MRTKKGSTKQHRVWPEPWKVVVTLTVTSGEGNSGETRKMRTLLGQQQTGQGVQSREGVNCASRRARQPDKRKPELLWQRVLIL